jgi:hypothetical protein
MTRLPVFCEGPCGRELAMHERALNRHGNPSSVCIPCIRFRKRSAYRRRYWTKASGLRAKRRAWSRAWYLAHRDYACAYARAARTGRRIAA